MSHPCPGGCGFLVPHSRLLCPYHWRQVSPTHQTELYRAWRALQRRPHDPEAQALHRGAMAAALGDRAPLPKAPRNDHR